MADPARNRSRAPRTRIDWDDVRARLENVRVAGDESSGAGSAALAETLARRASALRDRARDGRAREARGTPTLVVELDGERYGLAVEELAEMVPLRRMTPLPKAPAELTGIINVRGELKNVVDLLRLVAGDASRAVADDSADGYVLLLRGCDGGRGDGGLGLRVDSALGMVDIEPDDVTPAPERRFVAGVDGSGVRIVDLAALREHVLSVTDAAPRGETSGKGWS